MYIIVFLGLLSMTSINAQEVVIEKKSGKGVIAKGELGKLTFEFNGVEYIVKENVDELLLMLIKGLILDEVSYDKVPLSKIMQDLESILNKRKLEVEGEKAHLLTVKCHVALEKKLVTLSARKLSVKTVLNILAEQSGCQILFSKNTITLKHNTD